MIDTVVVYLYSCVTFLVFNDVFNTNVQLAIAQVAPQRLWTPRGEAAGGAVSVAGGARLC